MTSSVFYLAALIACLFLYASLNVNAEAVAFDVALATSSSITSHATSSSSKTTTATTSKSSSTTKSTTSTSKSSSSSLSITSKTTSTKSTSRSSTASPSATSCLKNGLSKTIGARVPEVRPATGCYSDYNVTVESISGSSTNFRFFLMNNGTKEYYSWAPEQTNCGPVGPYGFVSASDGALATDMQWQIQCSTGKMLPIFNGTQLASLGIELVELYPVASQSQADLDCYRKSLSLTTYPDLYFVFLDWILDTALQCSTELG